MMFLSGGPVAALTHLEPGEGKAPALWVEEATLREASEKDCHNPDPEESPRC